MTLTDPLPADLAFPGGGEPLTDDDLADLLDTVTSIADGAGMDDGEAMTYALNPESEGDPPRAQGFAITNDGLAEWALRKLAAVEAEAQETTERAQGWRSEIDSWEQSRLRPLKLRKAFFEAHLEAYMADLRDANPKCKSRPLPSGRLWSKGDSKPKVAVSDEAAVIAWAEANLQGEELESVVKVVKSVRVSALRTVAVCSEDQTGPDEYVAVVRSPDTGTIIPGASVEPAAISYGVQVGG